MARRRIAAKTPLAKFDQKIFGKASIELRATINPISGSRVHWHDGHHFMGVPKEVKQGLHEIAKDTAKLMRKNAPVGKPPKHPALRTSHNFPTGRLKKSIKAYETEMGGIVAVTAAHWKFVEGDTRPHWMTGKNGKGISFWGTFQSNGQNVTRKSGPNAGKRKGRINVPKVFHPGTTGQPFIYSSFKEMKYEALDYVVDAVRHGKSGGFTEGKKYL